MLVDNHAINYFKDEIKLFLIIRDVCVLKNMLLLVIPELDSKFVILNGSPCITFLVIINDAGFEFLIIIRVACKQWSRRGKDSDVRLYFRVEFDLTARNDLGIVMILHKISEPLYA